MLFLHFVNPLFCVLCRPSSQYYLVILVKIDRVMPLSQAFLFHFWAHGTLKRIFKTKSQKGFFLRF